MNLRLLEFVLRADLVVPYAVRACASLGLFEVLRSRRTADEAARLVGVQVGPLDTVLSYMASIGAVDHDENGYELSVVAKRILSDVRISAMDSSGLGLRSAEAASEMVDAMRTGLPAYELKHGRTYWSDIAERSAFADELHAEFTSITRLHGPTVSAYLKAWSCETVADVGCGTGSLATSIGAELPGTNILLVDSDRHTLASAVRTCGLVVGENRCTGLELDFRHDELPAADVYILSQVLHDWDDEQATRILLNIRRSMTPSSMLLVVERKLDDDAHLEYAAFMSLQMLVLFGGRERTIEQYRHLYAQAGLGAVDRLSLAGGFEAHVLRPTSD